MVKHEISKFWLRVKSIHPHLKEKLGPDNTRLLLKGLKWAAFGAGSLILIALLFVLLVVYPTLPDVRDLKGIAAAQSSTIFDREGNPLYIIHGEENRKNVELKAISTSAISAVLAIEDDGFYKHGGVDFGAILMAVCHEVRLCPTARGGSTITQQFIKNAYLSSERTYSRKLKEILLALKLESHYTKDEILGMYLNRIPYGSSIYGIERAAETFFGKSSKDLTLAEGAVLASIPKAPSYYSPYGANRYVTINLSEDDILKMGIKSEQDLVDINPEFISKGLIGKTYVFGEGESKRSIYVKGRVDFVLGRMRELGFINDEQVKLALEEANTKEFKPFREEIVAPHFVMYVRQFLEEKYGKDTVEKGGLKITTTIDPKLQAAAEKAVTDHEKLNLEKYKASNASLVSMDPDTGQIMAMVGSKDYWNEEIDGKVNIALRSRLPGSSFKPIVYAAAFLQGYAPSTVLYDVEMAFSGWYKPENYDGENRGPVTIRQALAWSLNIPAVQAGFLAGIPNVLDLARKMGVKLDQPDGWYGLSLALGAGEVRLIDMVGAYSIFANGGNKLDPVSILKIEDRNGNILDQYQGPQNKVMTLDPQVTYLINNVLSDAEARPEGWWRQQLSIPGQIAAAKTGTSNKKKGEVNVPFDTWTMGYTRNLVTGVWVGNNDGSGLNWNADGLSCAAPIWRDYMTAATEGKPRIDFDRPEGIRWVRISSKTGDLPSEFTPDDAIKTGVFASFSVPRDYDKSYKVLKIDKISGKLATEYTPEEAIVEKAFFEHHSLFPDNPEWEEPVRKWAKENNQDQVAPTEYDDVHTAETMASKPQIMITRPSANATVTGPYVGVWSDISSKAGIAKVDFYWDGALMDTQTKIPFKGSLKISDKEPKLGSSHIIKAVVFDSLYRSNQSSVEVRIGSDTTPPSISFEYPENSVRLNVGSSMATQVNAFDSNGDISKVEFLMDGQLQSTVRQAPYVWQFTVPKTVGEHTIKAVATDYANNKASDELTIISGESEDSISGSSRILEPFANASYGNGGRVLIKAYLDEESRANLKQLILTAKRKEGKTSEIARASGDPKTGGAAIYTFIWDSVPSGIYDLSLKIVLQDGTVRFSPRVPIVVR